MNDVLLRHGAEAMKAEGIHKTLSLEPVKDIYLRSDVGQRPRIRYLYVVGSIAVFILRHELLCRWRKRKYGC